MTLATVTAALGIVVTAGGVVTGGVALLVRVTQWATRVTSALEHLKDGQVGILDRLDIGAGKIHAHAETLAGLPCRRTANGSCPGIMAEAEE
jgi:hypothetical protein